MDTFQSLFSYLEVGYCLRCLWGPICGPPGLSISPMRLSQPCPRSVYTLNKSCSVSSWLQHGLKLWWRLFLAWMEACGCLTWYRLQEVLLVIDSLHTHMKSNDMIKTLPCLGKLKDRNVLSTYFGGILIYLVMIKTRIAIEYDWLCSVPTVQNTSSDSFHQHQDLRIQFLESEVRVEI